MMVVGLKLTSSRCAESSDANAMNRSREDLPVTISADWLRQLCPLRSTCESRVAAQLSRTLYGFPMNLIEELLWIGEIVVTAVSISLVWIIPLLIYRRFKLQPLIPPANNEEPDLTIRKNRNQLIFNIVFAGGISTFFFMMGMEICGCLFSSMGLYLLIHFELADRRRAED